jgi:hypothetical protein
LDVNIDINGLKCKWWYKIPCHKIAKNSANANIRCITFNLKKKHFANQVKKEYDWLLFVS